MMILWINSRFSALIAQLTVYFRHLLEIKMQLKEVIFLKVKMMVNLSTSSIRLMNSILLFNVEIAPALEWDEVGMAGFSYYQFIRNIVWVKINVMYVVHFMRTQWIEMTVYWRAFFCGHFSSLGLFFCSMRSCSQNPKPFG